LYPYLMDLGGRHLTLGHYSDAEVFLTRALASLDKAPSFDPLLSNIQRLGILQSLSRAYQYQGRYAEARSLFDRALALAEQVFGPDHSQTGSILNSIALLLLQQDQVDEAEALFEKALPITAKAGKDDIGYANDVAGLSLVHFKREDWAKAYAEMKSASAI